MVGIEIIIFIVFLIIIDITMQYKDEIENAGLSRIQGIFYAILLQIGAYAISTYIARWIQ